MGGDPTMGGSEEWPKGRDGIWNQADIHTNAECGAFCHSNYVGCFRIYGSGGRAVAGCLLLLGTTTVKQAEGEHRTANGGLPWPCG